MKKYLLLFTLVLFLPFTAQASNAERKIPSAQLTSPTVVSTTKATLYDVSIVATAAGGYVTIFDSATTDTADKTVLIELREGVQYNTGFANLKEGLKAYEGLFVYPSNASAIINYYKR